MIGRPPVKTGGCQERVTEESLGVAINCVGAAATSVDITATAVGTPFPIPVIGVTRSHTC